MNETIVHQYPPDLTALLIDAIPRLLKGKQDVLNFFKGCGVDPRAYSDVQRKVREDRENITKFEIVREILTRLNDGSDLLLKQRREVLKRVTQWEDFNSCYENQRVAAEGYVAKIQRIVNVKDSFTRMNNEREQVTRAASDQREQEARERLKRRAERDEIKKDLFALFAEPDAKKRGKALEGVLNRLFKSHGILIREAFTRVEPGSGVVEQIDGVIEFEGHIYLVELKWWSESLGPGEVSTHLVRVFNRGAARGLLISNSGYTDAAISVCRDSLQKSVFVLSTLEEYVHLLERDGSLVELIRRKVQSAIVDRIPLLRPLQGST